jgi:NAD(P)H-quinone oxidoreductase subunit 2
LIATLIATSIAGILSNPLFTLANNSVANTPILQSAKVSSTQASLVIPEQAENL